MSRGLKLQFFVCILGSIAILLFALGLEEGNPLAGRILTFAIQNWMWVLGGSTALCLVMTAAVLRKK